MTEAGKRLLRQIAVDHPTWPEQGLRADITAIEREAWLQGHDEAVRLQAEYDRDLVRDALTALRARVEWLTVRSPSDDEKPGWYWDGWHAAIDSILTLTDEAMPK